MPDAVVGVDAGGTCTIAVARRGNETSQPFKADAANPSALGIERAAEVIAQAVRGALNGDRAVAIAVGAAGAGRAKTAEGLRVALSLRFPDALVVVTDDTHIALRSMIPTGDGIVLIAGTGAIAYGEIGERSYRSGGFGYAIGDDGSGFAIGSAALKLLLRSYEGRAPRDPMLDAIARNLGVQTVMEALDYVYAGGSPIARVAALAPVVLEFAGSGERSASKIVQAAALELYELVRAVVRASQAAGALPLAFSGGLLRENNLLTFLVETRLSNELPHLTIVKRGDEPHVAALNEAIALLDAP
jgi:N-acetylglucosamine kinase-like BadF-type ATPase